MTRDEIFAAGEAVLRQAIKDRTGAMPVGRRTLDGLRILAARAYDVALDEAAPEPEGGALREAARPAAPDRPVIPVRILRDYWPTEGGRLAAGSVTQLAADVAKPLVRAGVVEWI
ncbi:hypothetical protein [Phreatobacter sp. AB_2022a]|uniref:hypothetical protein n=1 Tax=Phreatobacter sp. AB_2022a TaxID=3003134 RepID=UPI00056F40CC|nr:hypothetical protein [Phreatobacter sp. AB_2022a]MCZ0734408.1 hypothetical protein [Phreatobacter sp. AB_2022a]CEJ12082.1 hypothetical protein BN1110_02378 [bacterium YEK0313]